jgi:hypothetical protein
MTGSSRVWRAPSLAILTRRNPEESVLTACKSDASGLGSMAEFHACRGSDIQCEVICSAGQQS